uniref:CUB domain-containing protein n=1 Tax=Elaeophora elaphi TaxID=1147741 RepID=A0A0R3RM93_9BILA
ASTSALTSALISLPRSINHQTLTDLCGKRHIILDYKHPEYVINYPAASFTSESTDQEYQTGNYLASEERRNERLPYPLDFYINNDISVSHCQWLVTTDLYHNIGVEIKVSNESGYLLNITNENGLRKNCTIKLCTIRSDTSAILVQFRTQHIDNTQSTNRFSAKFIILPSSAGR